MPKETCAVCGAVVTALHTGGDAEISPNAGVCSPCESILASRARAGANAKRIAAINAKVGVA